MHIILTTNFSPWSPYSGGGQRSTHNLALALARRGHQVDVIYTKSPLEQIAVPEGLPYSVHWALFPTLRSRRASWLRNFSVFSVRSNARALIRPRGDTVIHSNGEEGALFPLTSNGRRIPFVLTPRYPHIPQPIQSPSSSLLSCFIRVPQTKYRLLGRALQRADACCTTSAFALEMLRRHYHFPRAATGIIPNGVDERFLQVRKQPKPQPAGPLVYFGRLAHSKGIDTLVEALSLLHTPTPELIIIGRGEIKKQLLHQARARKVAGQLTFRDWMSQEELAGILEQASMAVLPSREESFGNTMAEAMATGTPVVSTTAGSIPEVVEHGKSGVLVPPGNAEALAQAIDRLRQHPEEAAQLGEKGRRRVRRHFTWRAVAEAYEQIYTQVLS